ncbi:MAG TPA: hypothetical protein VIJ94_01090 [Caulobacteraceae bacterium]
MSTIDHLDASSDDELMATFENMVAPLAAQLGRVTREHALTLLKTSGVDVLGIAPSTGAIDPMAAKHIQKLARRVQAAFAVGRALGVPESTVRKVLADAQAGASVDT